MIPLRHPASPSNPYKRQIDAVMRVYDATERYMKRKKTTHESGDHTPTAATEEPAPTFASLPEDASTEESAGESGYESGSTLSSSDPSDISESEDDENEDEDEDEEDENKDEDAEAEAEDDDDAEQDRDAIINLRANRGEKPDYKLPDEEVEDIRPFLKDFLPKLKAANEELEAQKAAGTLQSSEITGDEEGDGEEQYIEMNLGLGVLEEKPDDAEVDIAEESKHESDADQGQEGQEEDILGKLMGCDKAQEPAGIQEVADTQGDT